MKISVIIPNYNTGKYIAKAIDSVLCQECDVECIVVDGGSTDGTLDILKGYDGRIKLLKAPAKGEADAVNRGLRIATGDIVSWLDADDLYTVGALRLVETYFHYEDYQWLYGKCAIIDKDGKEIRRYITRFKEYWQRRYSYNKLLVLDFIAQPTVFWRRSLLEDIGYLDDTERLVMDYEYWLRLGAVYRPCFIDAYLACWRSHGDSATSRELVQDMKDALRVANKYAPRKPLINVLQYLTYLVCVGAYSVLGRR